MKKLILAHAIANYKDIATKYSSNDFLQSLNDDEMRRGFERVAIKCNKQKTYYMVVLSKDDINAILKRLEELQVSQSHRWNSNWNKRGNIISYYKRFVDDWDKLPKYCFNLSGN